MVTYSTKVGNETFLYFFDTNFRLWTIYRIDIKTGYQIDEEAAHFSNKVHLLIAHPELDFVKHIEIEALPITEMVSNNTTVYVTVFMFGWEIATKVALGIKPKGDIIEYVNILIEQLRHEKEHLIGEMHPADVNSFKYKIYLEI